MVKQEKPVYLFLGADILDQENASLKEKELNKLKAGLSKQTRDFNLDILHCNDRSFSLKALQEKLLFISMGGGQRMVVVRNIQDAKSDVKEFLSSYVRNPAPGIILVLDSDRAEPKNAFIDGLSGSARVIRFKIEAAPSTFTLSRFIDSRRAQDGLKVLHQLLESGEKPERIMGGLRASWMRYPTGPVSLKKKLKILLQCDLDIKTGRIKPAFALERLVVNLCGLGNLPG